MSALDALRTARMFLRVAGKLPAGHLWYLARRMADEKPHRFAGQVRINSFFPPFPSPAFDRFVEAVLARRRVPYSVYLAVTGRCPARCAHCSHAGRPATELDTERLRKLVGEIKSLGACNLGFTGGEPLLRGDLEDLVAAAAPELATIVFTTGAGLDAARARSLAAAGVANVTLGIEWADASRHDQVRGSPGSFEQAGRAASALRSAGVYLSLSTIATREKLAAGELERIRTLAEAWGVQELRVLSPAATGGLAGCPEAMLGPAETAALTRFHAESNRRSGGPAVACFAYLESADLFGCGAGFHHLFIDSAGEVCPCDLTPLSFGSVTREPLAAIWQRMEQKFPLPRRQCLMKQVAPCLEAGGQLPVPEERAEGLCPARCAGEELPECYRRILPRAK